MRSEAGNQRGELAFVSLRKSKWANRFVMTAIIQGALAAALTSYLLYEGVWGTPAASRIVAGGGAGTWLTVVYLVYVPLGPIAAAVTALFYQHIEATLQKSYTAWTNLLAWGHIVLMNVGVVGATWLMMNAGYRGGALALTLAANNPAMSARDISTAVHEQVMVSYPPYIAVFIGIALLGAMSGGVGYILAWRRTVRT